MWVPLLGGIICFFLPKDNAAKNVALFSSLITLSVSITSLFYTADAYQSYNMVNYVWMKHIGNSLNVGLDSLGRILTFLTALAYPLILLATYKNNYKNASAYFGLLMLTQAGIMGVFTAMDALMFYFFWELALIPVYFLCSRWGGERRIQTTFKFFVYTFLGSLLMLLGIIYVYLQTPGRTFADGLQVAHSFSLQSFYAVKLSSQEQGWLFWLFFAAFAVKMPIFPLHTWQPDTYDQAPTSVTMVLSGLMVKMGLLGVMRWLIPVLPDATKQYAHVVMILSIIGIVYASVIALVQDNLKRLVAYSSIAHMGLMCAAVFAMNELSLQGVLLQMFNHGINIIGLWIVIDKIEARTGIKHMSQLGGLARRAPALTIALVVISLANIALPLTNAFAGELLMFSGIFQFNKWYAAAAGISIILAAVYTLTMVQKVFLGEPVAITENTSDISVLDKVVLGVIITIIFILGVYPQPVLDLTASAVSTMLKIK